MVSSDPPYAPEAFTTHKDRAEWFSQRASFPMREGDPRNLEAFYALRREQPGPARDWTCLGPSNIAGRVNALVADPNDSNILYAGSAAGGVWKTDSGGRRWTSTWPQWYTASIGSLAIDPRNPKVIYCGTGEANLSADDYPGSGVMISDDAGMSWRMLATSAECGLPRRIGVMVVDPTDPSGKTLYVGGVTHDDMMAAGLFSSSDGGVTWLRDDFFTKQNYQCLSIAIHPEGIVFTTILARGVKTGIWRRTGQKWEHLTRGLPPSDKLGRISLAIAPSQPDTIYALVGDDFGKGMLGIYRSRNKGERWTQVDRGIVGTETQSGYNNAIAVSPEDPGLVACGGRDLLLSRNGGASWVRASEWDALGTPRYSHGDLHAIVFGERPFRGRIYSGNDGGVFVTEDFGKTWKPRNRDMVTTQFYSLAVAPAKSGIIGGGTQDNGTLLTGIGTDIPEYSMVQAGDGSAMVIDPMKENHIFASTSEFRIARFRGAGGWRPVGPKAMTEAERKQVPIAQMVIGREPDPGAKTVWTASRRLWRTLNSGRDWKPSSPFLDGSAVTAIDVAGMGGARILVGTAKGGIFRSLDGGKTWSGNLAGPEIPSRMISDFETHPVKPETVLAVTGGSGLLSRLEPGAMGGSNRRLQHVFLSEDNGTTWRMADPQELPDVACYSATFETHEPYRVFISTDCGVWATSDFRAWSDWTGNLPTVRVTMLTYHDRDRVLTAATYGRGIWRIEVPPATGTIEVSVHN